MYGVYYFPWYKLFIIYKYGFICLIVLTNGWYQDQQQNIASLGPRIKIPGKQQRSEKKKVDFQESRESTRKLETTEELKKAQRRAKQCGKLMPKGSCLPKHKVGPEKVSRAHDRLAVLATRKARGYVSCKYKWSFTLKVILSFWLFLLEKKFSAVPAVFECLIRSHLGKKFIIYDWDAHKSQNNFTLEPLGRSTAMIGWEMATRDSCREGVGYWPHLISLSSNAFTLWGTRQSTFCGEKPDPSCGFLKGQVWKYRH